MTKDLKVSFLLDGGVDDRSLAELKAPVIAPGSSPKLAQSINTRLSVVRGTPVRAPAITAISSTGAASVECHGVVSCEAGQATLEFFLPGDEGAALGNRALYGEGAYSTSILRQTFSPSVLQTGYVPSTVESLVAMAPSEGISKHQAIAYDATNQRLWVLLYSNITVFAYVLDTAGKVVAPLQYLFDESGLSWLGVTWHGANGLYAWYEDNVGIRKRNLTLSGSLITVGGETAVYTPAALGDAADVCRIDDTYVAFLGTSSGSANDATLRKHNVVSGAETTVTLTNAATGTATKYAIACETLPALAAQRIAVAYSNTSAAQVQVFDTSLASIWGPTSFGSVVTPPAYPIVRFQDNASGAFVIAGLSDVSGSFSGGTDTLETTFFAYTVSAGTLSGSASCPWAVIANRGAQLTIDGRLYPMFFLHRAYSGPTPPSLSSDDYLDDPGIDAMLVAVSGSTVQVAPVARLGVVRGSSAPARALPNLLPSASGAVGYGPTAWCPYLVDRGGLNSETGFAARTGVVNIVPRSLHAAHDKSGVALVAAGLPVQWDGTAVTELGAPLYRPHLKLVTTGGSGSAFPAGAYSFLCYYEWYDAAGIQHRSRISNIVSFNATGTEQPVLTTTAAMSGAAPYHGQTLLQNLRVVWFGTAADGITYHQITGPSAISSGAVTFANPAVAVIDSPQVYSTGEAGQELLPQPAPPLYDIAIVGNRAWGIDAEFRNRAVYSKLRAAGTGYEWNPALEVNFPSGGGTLQRIFELGGTPVFVATRGTFYVTGEGPDNSGAGGLFSAPTKVSEHGCSNPLALGVFPGGAVWQDHDRWVVMRGQQTAYVPDVTCDFDPSGTIVLRRSNEVVFTNRNGGAKVYNYELDRWTTWDSNAVPATSVVANVPYSDFRAFLYSPDTGSLYKLEDSAVSDSATSMTVGTDWTLLSGDWQDEVKVSWVVLRALRAGPHGLRIRIYTDFEASPTTDMSWTNTELAAMADGQGCYTIRLEPARQATRAIKITVSDDTSAETDSAGMRPVALTIYYSPLGNMRNDAFVTGAATK